MRLSPGSHRVIRLDRETLPGLSSYEQYEETEPILIRLFPGVSIRIILF